MTSSMWDKGHIWGRVMNVITTKTTVTNQSIPHPVLRDYSKYLPNTVESDRMRGVHNFLLKEHTSYNVSYTDKWF